MAGGALGSWSLTLAPNTPKTILDQLDYWGSIVITSSPVDAARYGDTLFDHARYIGVMRGREFQVGSKGIAGVGQSLWIGDEDDKGHVIETAIGLIDQNFNDSLEAIIPPTVTLGDVFPQSGLFTQTFKLVGRRFALDYFCEMYGCEWRVRGKAVLDVGLPEDLYSPNPTCAILRGVPEGGIDTDGVRALPGDASLSADMDDFSTRVVMVGQGSGNIVAVGTADIDSGLNPYQDLFGNDLKMTRLVSESNTSLINADARAEITLDPFTVPREAVKLSTRTHDIKGDLVVGGYVWVEDHDAKLVGTEQVNFKGMRLYPLKLRVTEIAWPVEAGMGVAYRHWDGTWIDLTPYIEWESGDTTVTVNAFDRALTSGTSPRDPVAPGQVGADDGVAPDIPEWVAPFDVSVYPSPVDGMARAEVFLEWETPLNFGLGTVVEDGSHYTIRYRRVNP